MKKIILRFIAFVVLAFALIFVINSQTDYMSDFKEYCPRTTEKFPHLSQGITDLSKMLSALPSLSQIIGHITKEDLPIEPENVLENSQNKNSPQLCFYPEENAGIILKDGKSVSLFGTLKAQQKTNIIVQFVDSKSKVISRDQFSTDTSYEFSKTVQIPQYDGDYLRLDIYIGEKPSGDFIGFVNQYLYFKKIDEKWIIDQSPVLESNKSIYNQRKSTSEFLKPSEFVNSDKAQIKSVALQLTKDAKDDYERISMLHDWICGYLHYDNDSLEKKDLPSYTATDVLKTRRAVCLGYANLYAALCRSINIPCAVVTGYALGISSGESSWSDKILKSNDANHAWNEVFINDRWIIVDTTWDSNNNYENNEMKKSNYISHLYFDANIDFFSTNHKIVSYMSN